MNLNKRYKFEVLRRGGATLVADKLGVPVSTITRRCFKGATQEMLDELKATPQLPRWRLLNRLRTDPKFRRKFAQRAASRLADEKFKPARADLDLLESTFRQFRGTQAGKAGWRTSKGPRNKTGQNGQKTA